MDFFDVAIIGAGFSGLSCAERLSKNGLSVVLFDKKKELNQHIHTTGIIVDEALHEWDVDPNLIRPINQVRLYLPNLKKIDLKSSSYNFYLTDTGGILNDKKNKILNSNLKILLGHLVKKINFQHSFYEFPDFNIKSKYLVIANGANSSFLKQFNFETHDKFLAGYELEFPLEHVDLKSIMNVFIHPQICKGYIGWAIPGVNCLQVGLAVDKGQELSIDKFLKHIQPVLDFDKSKMTGSRSGLIPVGHTSRNLFKNNCLVIGDAAGYVSPLTAGGIHTAMRYGRLGADLICDLNLSEEQKTKTILINYQNKIPNFKFKHFLRSLYNFFNHKIFWDLTYWSGSLYIGSKLIFFSKKKLK